MLWLILFVAAVFAVDALALREIRKAVRFGVIAPTEGAAVMTHLLWVAAVAAVAWWFG